MLDNALSIPDIARIFGFGLADYGFKTSNSVVTQITPGGPAARAGLHVGDRVTIDDHSERANYALVRGIGPYAGAKLDLNVASRPPRHVILVAVPESPSTRFLVAIRFALAALTTSVAAALLLMRPEPSTWGFFLYCLSVITLPGAVSAYLMPWRDRALASALNVFIENASFAGGVLFAWTFAGQPLKGRTVTVVLSTCVLTLIYTLVNDAQILYGVDYPDLVDRVFQFIIVLAMLAGFIHSYHFDDSASRQRLRWMIAALLITVPITYILMPLFPSYITYGQYVGLIGLQAILP
ncbi:MAG: hypothetical protein JO277_14125, partial [Candidatus Eremiobacteraeota bacterium]|nr:hypothetical protein [Candidatus Eremiobacteraeota bacterium]